ncbi:MAG: hypothetical protein ACR2IF_19335 [Terriglobales bacterium]
MRAQIAAAALVLAIAIPVCAQRTRGFAPRTGATISVRPGGRVAFRGGFAIGHNPGFRVFIGPRVFHHPRHFAVFPFGYPYAFSYAPYPFYPPLGYYDYGYANYAPPASYLPEHDTGVNNEIYQLRAEVDQLRQEQMVREQRTAAALAPPPAPVAPERLPTIILVFRDGRREEIRAYAISGTTLWILTEQRARKVPLADLDLAATADVNDERGVPFRLPAQ